MFSLEVMEIGSRLQALSLEEKERKEDSEDANKEDPVWAHQTQQRRVTKEPSRKQERIRLERNGNKLGLQLGQAQDKLGYVMPNQIKIPNKIIALGSTKPNQPHLTYQTYSL